MMLRWISSVPPAIDCAGTEMMISGTIPFAGPSGPAIIAAAPTMSACTRADRRAISDPHSLAIEPSGPGWLRIPDVGLEILGRLVGRFARCSSGGRIRANRRETQCREAALVRERRQ